MLDFGFYNMDCMEGMKQFPDKYFDLAVVDPPYGDGSANSRGGGTGTGSGNGSTGTSRHIQRKNVRQPDGTWAAKFSKKSLRGMFPRSRNTLTNCFASHGTRLSGGAIISTCRRHGAS